MEHPDPYLRFHFLNGIILFLKNSPKRRQLFLNPQYYMKFFTFLSSDLNNTIATKDACEQIVFILTKDFLRPNYYYVLINFIHKRQAYHHKFIIKKQKELQQLFEPRIVNSNIIPRRFPIYESDQTDIVSETDFSESTWSFMSNGSDVLEEELKKEETEREKIENEIATSQQALKKYQTILCQYELSACREVPKLIKGLQSHDKQTAFHSLKRLRLHSFPDTLYVDAVTNTTGTQYLNIFQLFSRFIRANKRSLHLIQEVCLTCAFLLREGSQQTITAFTESTLLNFLTDCVYNKEVTTPIQDQHREKSRERGITLSEIPRIVKSERKTKHEDEPSFPKQQEEIELLHKRRVLSVEILLSFVNISLSVIQSIMIGNIIPSLLRSIDVAFERKSENTVWSVHPRPYAAEGSQLYLTPDEREQFVILLERVLVVGKLFSPPYEFDRVKSQFVNYDGTGVLMDLIENSDRLEEKERACEILAMIHNEDKFGIYTQKIGPILLTMVVDEWRKANVPEEPSPPKNKKRKLKDNKETGNTTSSTNPDHAPIPFSNHRKGKHKSNTSVEPTKPAGSFWELIVKKSSRATKNTRSTGKTTQSIRKTLDRIMRGLWGMMNIANCSYYVEYDWTIDLLPSLISILSLPSTHLIRSALIVLSLLVKLPVTRSSDFLQVPSAIETLITCLYSKVADVAHLTLGVIRNLLQSLNGVMCGQALVSAGVVPRLIQLLTGTVSFPVIETFIEKVRRSSRMASILDPEWGSEDKDFDDSDPFLSTVLFVPPSTTPQATRVILPPFSRCVVLETLTYPGCTFLQNDPHTVDIVKLDTDGISMYIAQDAARVVELFLLCGKDANDKMLAQNVVGVLVQLAQSRVLSEHGQTVTTGFLETGEKLSEWNQKQQTDQTLLQYEDRLKTNNGDNWRQYWNMQTQRQAQFITKEEQKEMRRDERRRREAKRELKMIEKRRKARQSGNEDVNQDSAPDDSATITNSQTNNGYSSDLGQDSLLYSPTQNEEAETSLQIDFDDTDTFNDTATMTSGMTFISQTDVSEYSFVPLGLSNKHYYTDTPSIMSSPPTPIPSSPWPTKRLSVPSSVHSSNRSEKSQSHSNLLTPQSQPLHLNVKMAPPLSSSEVLSRSERDKIRRKQLEEERRQQEINERLAEFDEEDFVMVSPDLVSNPEEYGFTDSIPPTFVQSFFSEYFHPNELHDGQKYPIVSSNPPLIPIEPKSHLPTRVFNPNERKPPTAPDPVIQWIGLTGGSSPLTSSAPTRNTLFAQQYAENRINNINRYQPSGDTFSTFSRATVTQTRSDDSLFYVESVCDAARLLGLSTIRSILFVAENRTYQDPFYRKYRESFLEAGGFDVVSLCICHRNEKIRELAERIYVLFEFDYSVE
ncbi:hypothetical protein BLNAU_8912 [Blattamonas nauphoetae]|uniref:Uncharacterized protein n=1 Tax=Blattamonas nauphoetae TaxID=2049346 RepID=A0ABQ9XXA9_9EUKA|nr:hypothetical protein BLNAU_8912 [Blattamonas nauphoetae]